MQSDAPTTSFLKECNAFPCDTGSAREVLEADPELAGFDLSLLTPDWTSKAGQFGADERTLNERARWVRQWLLARPESVIVCIAHGDILRRITSHPTQPSTYQWKNAEVQLWTFDARAEPHDATLRLVKYITAEGQAAPTSSSSAMSNASTGTASSFGGGGKTGLPTLSSSGSFDITRDLDNASAAAAAQVAEMEKKVRAKAAQVQSQTDELQQLEARLAAAEARKAEVSCRSFAHRPSPPPLSLPPFPSPPLSFVFGF